MATGLCVVEVLSPDVELEVAVCGVLFGSVGVEVAPEVGEES